MNGYTNCGMQTSSNVVYVEMNVKDIRLSEKKTHADLILELEVVVTQHCECTKRLNHAHFKMATFMSYDVTSIFKKS